MTVGAVRVTVAKACQDRHHLEGMPYTVCPACRSTGVVWEPVSCASCKHWGQDSRHHLFWGEGTGFCALADCDGYEPSKFPDAPLHVQGREGGGLLTVSTFACSAWEAKP